MTALTEEEHLVLLQSLSVKAFRLVAAAIEHGWGIYPPTNVWGDTLWTLHNERVGVVLAVDPVSHRRARVRRFRIVDGRISHSHRIMYRTARKLLALTN